MNILLKGQLGRMNTGATRQNHADPVCFALHDGIGGNRGTEDNPLQLFRIFITQQDTGDIQERMY